MSTELAQIISDGIVNRVDGAGSDLSHAEVEEEGVWVSVEGNLDVSALSNTIIGSTWLANHDAEVAAKVLDEATVLVDSFGMISKRDLEPYWEGHDDAVYKIAQGIRCLAVEYRKTEAEGK